MPTRRGAGLLVAAVALWGAGRFFGIAELYVVAAVSAALVVVGLLAVRLTTATIAARRTMSAVRLLPDAGADVTVELRNDGRLPSGLLLVEDCCPRTLASQARFVIPGIAAGRTASVTYRITGQHRGRFTLGPLRVRVRDPFGVAQRVRRYRASDEVVVYPRIERLPDRSTPGTYHGSGHSQTRRLFNTGDEFYTMREYATGDDLRQVHWPSTAHRQTLMVRQQEQPWQTEGTVFCDTRLAVWRRSGPDAPIEKAIAVAASIVWHLADEGFRLRLATEEDLRGVDAARWERHLDRLAELVPSRVPSTVPAVRRLRSGGQGLLVAVIAPSPDGVALAANADLGALLFAGRVYAGRLALVVDPSSGRDDRAEQTARLLRGGGWRAATIAPREPLAGPWEAVVRPRSRARAAVHPRAAVQQ